MSDATVMTVLGPIDPGELGITITHEHLLAGVSAWFAEPEKEAARAQIDRPVQATPTS